MNKEQLEIYKRAAQKSNHVVSVDAERLLAIIALAEQSMAAAAPHAQAPAAQQESIDTPNFWKCVDSYVFASRTGALLSVAKNDLRAHIDAHTAAAVAKAREEGRQAGFQQALTQSKPLVDKLRAEAALAQSVDLSKLMRYDEYHGMAGSYMTFKEDGDYVMFEDVEALLAAAPAAPYPTRECAAEALTPSVGAPQAVEQAHGCASCGNCIGHDLDCPSHPANRSDAWSAAQPQAVAEQRVDDIVTALYRRFKDWSKRGFGPDDVTWCEVKADVMALIAASQQAAAEQHPDDMAVDKFAAAMKDKMAVSRAKGRGGWDDPEECDVEDLADMLVRHVEKGDPVDIGNFCMMIWNRVRDTGPDTYAAIPEALEAYNAPLLAAIAAPAIQQPQDAIDAARYRWLRDECKDPGVWNSLGDFAFFKAPDNGGLDSAIDHQRAAIARKGGA